MSSDPARLCARRGGHGAVVRQSWGVRRGTGVIIAWAASGPAFHFNDTWQLVVNTGTTIVTFLMVS